MESNAWLLRPSVLRKPVSRSTSRGLPRFSIILLLTAGTAFGQPLFTDVTNEPDVTLFHSRSIAFGDYDNDGRPDLFQVDRHEPRVGLLHNEGDGSFADRTETVRSHVPLDKLKGGGSIFGDYDNDGDLDLFVTVGAISVSTSDRNVLLRNDRGVFTPVTHEAGLIDSLPTDQAIWLDYDRDGFLDLYTANIGWDPKEELIDPTVRNILYHNNGDGTFSDQSSRSGSAVTPRIWRQLGWPHRGRFQR